MPDNEQTLKDDRKYNQLTLDCFKEILRFIYHFYNSKKVIVYGMVILVDCWNS